MQPGDFALASTVESLELADDLLGRLEGRSSIARLGITVHSTAAVFEPGWVGTATMELSNLGRMAVERDDQGGNGQLGRPRRERVDHLGVAAVDPVEDAPRDDPAAQLLGEGGRQPAEEMHDPVIRLQTSDFSPKHQSESY